MKKLIDKTFCERQNYQYKLINLTLKFRKHFPRCVALFNTFCRSALHYTRHCCEEEVDAAKGKERVELITPLLQTNPTITTTTFNLPLDNCFRYCSLYVLLAQKFC